MPKGIWKNGLKPTPPSRKGVKLSQEHKDSLKKAIMGNTWNKGRTHSEESRVLKSQNSARYWLGKVRGPQSPETIKKRSDALMGHAVSEFTRERMRKLSKGKFGPEHPKWVEYKIETFHRSIRGHRKYREWKKSVLDKYGRNCVLCDKSDGRIDVDHIKRFVDILTENNVTTLEQALFCEELWDVNNGRTLCYGCHRKTDTWGSKKETRLTKPNNCGKFRNLPSTLGK